jgi:pre-mRNA-processing factor SLU7
VQELQLFAWKSEAHGNDVHLNADPTQGQLLHQAFKAKKEQLHNSSKASVLAKYEGEEYLEMAPKELRLGQMEEYVEYSRAVSMGRSERKRGRNIQKMYHVVSHIFV